MNNDHFTKNLRELRLEKGYTQEQLAEKLGVSAQSVSRWECGNTLPDVMLLPELAKIYGVTVDDLFREKANAYPNYAHRLLAVYEATRKTEDFLAAEQEFTKLLAGTHTADDLRCFGVLYHYMLQYCSARAKQYLEAAVTKAEKNDWVWASAAQQKIALCCDLGKGMEEAKQYEAEVKKNPMDAKNWLLCVAAYYYADEVEYADKLVKEALAKFPEEALLHVYAGDICKDLGQYEEAFAHWRRVLELDKTITAATFAMAFCYEELEQYENAYQVWTELLEQLTREGFSDECQLVEEHRRKCMEHKIQQ